MPEFWTAGQKLAWIADHVEQQGRENSLNTIPWTTLIPDAKNNWIRAANADEFSEFMAMGTKEGKSAKGKSEPDVLFRTYSHGINSSRDGVVYDFNKTDLERHIEIFAEKYNAEIDRYKRRGVGIKVDEFVDYSVIKWSRNLKRHLSNEDYLQFSRDKIMGVIYRPFTSQS